MPDTSAFTSVNVTDLTFSQKRVFVSDTMDALVEVLGGIPDGENPTDPKLVSNIEHLYKKMNDILQEHIIPADWYDEFLELHDSAERFLHPRPPTPDPGLPGGDRGL